MDFSSYLKFLMEINNTTRSSLADYAGVSRQAVDRWLNGSMPSLDKATKIAEFYKMTVNDLVQMEEGKKAEEKIRIPILGDVSAGAMEIASLLTGKYLSIDSDLLDDYPREECFALKVNGKSMEPEFPDGSYIIVHQQKQCADGDYVIVLDETTGNNTFKKYQHNDCFIELVPLNSAYATLKYRKQDINRLVIQGVAINKRV